MDVCGSEPCTFRQSSFGFASLFRLAITLMIGEYADSGAGANAVSSSSLWWRENTSSLSRFRKELFDFQIEFVKALIVLELNATTPVHRKPDTSLMSPHKQGPGRRISGKEPGANGCTIAGRLAASIRTSRPEVPTNNAMSICHHNGSTGRVRNIGTPFQIAGQNDMVPRFAVLNDGALRRTQVAIR
jgi:hypothetical protein